VDFEVTHEMCRSIPKSIRLAFCSVRYCSYFEYLRSPRNTSRAMAASFPIRRRAWHRGPRGPRARRSTGKADGRRPAEERFDLVAQLARECGGTSASEGGERRRTRRVTEAESWVSIARGAGWMSRRVRRPCLCCERSVHFAKRAPKWDECLTFVRLSQ
jgi:hypothetical protein